MTQAEANGGGWVQIVIHHLCLGCETYSTPPATLDAFLAWLEPRATSGTVVLTTREALHDAVVRHDASDRGADCAGRRGDRERNGAVSANAADNVAVGRVEFYRGST